MRTCLAEAVVFANTRMVVQEVMDEHVKLRIRGLVVLADAQLRLTPVDRRLVDACAVRERQGGLLQEDGDAPK